MDFRGPSRRKVRGAGVVALALLQLFAAALAPTVDAWLDAGSSQTVHIESDGATSCPSIHDHVYCQLCRVLTLAGATSPVASGVVDRSTVEYTVAAPAADRIRPGCHLPGSPGARAPPLA